MTDTFISPYDDFERFLTQDDSDRDHLIPVLLGLTRPALSKIDEIAKIVAGLEVSDMLIDFLKGFEESFNEATSKLPGRVFEVGFKELIDAADRLIAEMDINYIDFMGRIVVYVPDVKSIESFTQSFVLPTFGEGDADTIPVFEPLWIGPNVAVTRLFQPSAVIRQVLPKKSANPTIGTPIIGIIDDGIGYLNAAFRHEDQTRFFAIQQQKRPRVVDGNFDLGQRVLRSDKIDDNINAIRQRKTTEAKIYDQENRSFYGDDFYHGTSRAITHGTHMLGLAAAKADAFQSSTERDLLAVQLPPFSVRDTSGHYLSFFAFLGVRFMLREMLSQELQSGTPGELRPLILNISLGALAGPKDGSGSFEREFSREIALFEAATGNKVTAFFAYGNSYEDRQVARLSVPKSTARHLDWHLPIDNRASSFLELRSPDPIEVSLEHAQTGITTSFVSPAPGQMAPLIHNGNEIARVYGNLSARYDTDGNLQAQADGLIIALPPTNGRFAKTTAAAGIWKVTIKAKEKATNVICQIQSGGTPPGYITHGRQSFFANPQTDSSVEVTPNGSFSALIPTQDSRHISVGAAAWSGGGNQRPMRYTSAGGVFDGNAGPGQSAEVEDYFLSKGVLGLGTLSGTTARLGGTSAASAIAASEFADRIRALAKQPMTQYPGIAKSNVDKRLGSNTVKRPKVKLGS